jgi:hypothetical protein
MSDFLRFREDVKREMRRRKALHCVYGFSSANGLKMVADAKSARYFSSDESFEKWADLVTLTDCGIFAIHARR